MSREISMLKYGWRFRREALAGAAKPDFDDSAWEQVRVPHDWAIGGPFDVNNDLQYTAIVQDGELKKRNYSGRTGGLPHVGEAWYRLNLTLEQVE